MRSPAWKLTLALVCLLPLILVGCSQDQPTLPQGPQSHLLGLGDKSIPAGYYDTVDTSDAAALRASLHLIIEDCVKIPYTSTATDTWNVLEAAYEDPADPGNILDVYKNASYPKYGAGNNDYQREHAWPKSYGFPNDGSTNYPYTDCHHLFLCDGSYNSTRSNKPYRYCSSGCTEEPTVVNDGAGGGSGVYPGNSNWTAGAYTAGSWETWIGRRGDVARALLYMDVRYEGGTNPYTGVSEPDLILTDNESLIDGSNTGSNESVGYMGMLSVLLEWNAQDPVDDKERAANDVIYQYQGNRNPFVDHPEWIDCVFADACGSGGDTTPPAAPTGLAAVAGDGTVSLDWNDNAEGDLAGYTVYRADVAGGPYTALNGSLVPVSAYDDGAAANGTTWYYVVTASDASGNESSYSAEASATPQGGGSTGGAAWINEFHYDNSSTDTGEFVEVAGEAGTDLSGWTLYGYNGNGGGVYDSVALSGTLSDQMGGYGTLSFAFTGLQNGSPDGIALVDGTGAVADFIAYEGDLTATDGPAVGLTATDIGVAEGSSTPVGWSLQLAGSGTSAADFTWQAPAAATPGAVNTGQTLGSGTPPSNQPPTANANGPYAGVAGQAVAFSSAGSSDPDGTIVTYLWDFGDGATSGSANPTHVYADANTYTVTLTVTDDQGAEDTDTTTATIDAAPTSDVVTINSADYSNRKGQLTVEAVSTESNATLTVVGYGVMSYNSHKNLWSLKVSTSPAPSSVTVTSDYGGSDTASVSVGR